ncbi:hypothetical protein [Neorhizobium galegae]|uniref:hypothetical protein n=1 Tax=Neorhizobium galegae TaxID=399 RepID=UPI0021031BF7|nr:hypothetical protein [Neorhizobium galegae]MCQ1855639.1 hypothetical protein [Neorhizobium galegae]
MLDTPSAALANTQAIVIEKIRSSISEARRDFDRSVAERKIQTVLSDVILLARCAKTSCLITYSDAITLRGHGNPQNGQWLDEVYAFAIAPLGFPDLTMLVVNKSTKRPSPSAFEARRSILSKVYISDVPTEQKRCVWYPDYERLLGPLEHVPVKYQLVRLATPQSSREREISRAVTNAIGRVSQFGIEKTSIGKAYPNSLSRAELMVLVDILWERQKGRCALTGQAFELRADEEGGVQDDRVSLDRIDNLQGYADVNVQLVTQFANRARGTLPVNEARKRLVQFD